MERVFVRVGSSPAFANGSSFARRSLYRALGAFALPPLLVMQPHIIPDEALQLPQALCEYFQAWCRSEVLPAQCADVRMLALE